MEQMSGARLSEAIAYQIAELILSGEIENETKLRQEELAATLQVSRIPVREAFQILNRDGLIKLRQNKGAIVLGVTDKYIRDHYQLRAILESSCARLACENGADLTDLQQIQDDAVRIIGEKTFYQYADNNRAFHSEIWHMSGNEKMEHMVSELWNGLSMGNMVTEEDYARISHTEHAAILAAMQERDGDKAYAAMYAHIMRSQDDMLTYYN